MLDDTVRRLRGTRQSPRARVALVVDEPDSAQDDLARSIVPSLRARLDVETLYLSDHDPGRSWTPAMPSELFHELFCGAYDLVHTFSAAFGVRVFEPAIAAEPALRDADAVLERALKIPLTVSLTIGASLDPAHDRFTEFYAGVFVPGRSAGSWCDFFDGILDAVRAESGPLSELAVWERVKAWRALVERIPPTVEAP